MLNPNSRDSKYYPYREKIASLFEQHRNKTLVARHLQENFEEFSLASIETLRKVVSKVLSADDINTDTVTVTNQYDSPTPLPAVHPETGKFMDIDTYCEFYGMPRNAVKSYKLITHGKVPCYNIAFAGNTEDVDLRYYIDEIIEKDVPRQVFPYPTLSETNDVEIISLGDVHVGMSVSDTPFKLEWNREILFERAKIVINKIDYSSDKIVIIFGGDIADGQNARTVRGLSGSSTHNLPQNMDNKTQIETAIEFIYFLLDNISDRTASPVEAIFLTNSNHGGLLDYAIGRICEEGSGERYEGQVNFILQNEFIDSYTYAGRDFLITHGYDESIMNRGLPKILKPDHVKFIEKIIRHKQLTNQVYLLRFDQHQHHDTMFDAFRDILHPAFANPSAWVSYNFAADYKGGFKRIKLDKETFSTELIEF